LTLASLEDQKELLLLWPTIPPSITIYLVSGCRLGLSGVRSSSLSVKKEAGGRISKSPILFVFRHFGPRTLMVNEHKSEEEEKKDKRKGESLLLLFCFF
jgi:hypothetical protein